MHFGLKLHEFHSAIDRCIARQAMRAGARRNGRGRSRAAARRQRKHRATCRFCGPKAMRDTLWSAEVTLAC